ncbi:MAG: hypothetical protein ACOC1O_01935 [bacterium]
MLELVFSGTLIFSGGFLLASVLANYRIMELQEKHDNLLEKFKKRKYLYIVKKESYWSDFEKGEVVELIRDCRDGEGYFENKKGTRDFLKFSYVKLLQNNIKKL